MELGLDITLDVQKLLQGFYYKFCWTELAIASLLGFEIVIHIAV